MSTPFLKVDHATISFQTRMEGWMVPETGVLKREI